MSGFHNTALIGASGQGGGYTIENSLRLRSSASAYLSRTLGTPTNANIWTWSGWIKRGTLGGNVSLMGVVAGGTDTNNIVVRILNDEFNMVGGSTIWRGSSQVFRDPSAWYHFVISVDTTQATASNRILIYVNGVQITAFKTLNNPTQNTPIAINTASAPMQLGAYNTATFFDGYLTEVNFIDGQALDPSSFGEYNADTGVWQPVAYSGTYGTNGFYLPFSDATNTTTLAADASGNGNDWTPNNISLTSGATYDSMTDTPTPYADGGNYAVLNPLDKGTSVAVSEGNSTPSIGAVWQTIRATMAFPTTGKWYVEALLGGSSGNGMVGIGTAAATLASYAGADAFGWSYNAGGGQKFNNGSGVAYGASYAPTDLIGVAFDADAGTLTFYKNNVSQGVAYSGLTNASYFLMPSINTSQWAVNFGQRPFAYTPPTGFLPLHTGNLPDSAIVDGSTQMGILTYSGTNGDRLIATGETGIDGEVNFTPDLVWNKSRNTAGYGALWDSVRGGTNALQTYSTTAELNSEGGDIDSFVEGGTNFGTGTINASWGNTSGSTYVSWQWKAGTAFSNDAGTNGATIASVGSVNQDAGFSIVTYTANGTAAQTIGHGLNDVPAMIITKVRNNAGGNWGVYHKSVGNTKALFLNLPNGTGTSSLYWNNTTPTSSVFSVGSNNTDTNWNTYNFVAYCFAEVEGYSKFGSYTGNGSPDGTFVHLGFRPAFVMFKSTLARNWVIRDTSRNTYNAVTNDLYPDLPATEYAPGDAIDFLSNGFKLRATGATFNGSGEIYIYAAFAENPFKNSLAR